MRIWVPLWLGAGCVGAPVPVEVGDACAPSRHDRVACVVDGDTVSLGSCSASIGERVRLLGVNAPETEKSGQAGECFAEEAKQALTQLVDQRTLRIEFDWACDDVFGTRSLAYLWLEDGDVPVHVNAWLLEEGYARRYANSDLEGELSRGDELDAAEARARDRGLGLWGVCGG